MMLSIALIFNRLAISGDSQMYQTIVSVHLYILKGMLKKFSCSDALWKMKVGFGLLIQWVPTGILRHRNMRKLQVPVAGFKEKGSLYKYRKGATAILVRDANLRFLGEMLIINPSQDISNILGISLWAKKKGGTFAHYVSVRDDIQSVFMADSRQECFN